MESNVFYRKDIIIVVNLSPAIVQNIKGTNFSTNFFSPNTCNINHLLHDSYKDTTINKCHLKQLQVLHMLFFVSIALA